MASVLPVPSALNALRRSSAEGLIKAAACVFWTGVPVQAVVEACGGIDREAVFMTSAGVDHEPTGLDPKKAMIERSVPKKVYKDAILAWERNGVSLPNAHGGPVSMRSPG